MQQDQRHVIAREDEEIVSSKFRLGSPNGRRRDQIIDGDFAVLEFSSSPADQRYVCACCGQPGTVREPVHWNLGRGWVR